MKRVRPRLHSRPERSSSASDRKRRVDLGLMMFPTDYSIGPAQLALSGKSRLRVALVSGAHPHPDQPAHAVARRRASCPRSTAARSTRSSRSTAAAAVTERLKLGTGICLVAQHDPIVLAKTVAIARPHLRRPLPLRHRRRVERGRDGAPRRRPEAAPRGRARERSSRCRSCGRRTRPRSTASSCSFSPSWSWPKPVQQAAPADPHGRRRRTGDVPPRRRVLRRLDADPRPRARSSASSTSSARRRRRPGATRRRSICRCSADVLTPRCSTTIRKPERRASSSRCHR